MGAKKVVLAIAVCAGLALVGGRVEAGSSPLLDGFFSWEADGNDPDNRCFLNLDGTNFQNGGIVEGSGTGGEEVSIAYDGTQPTSTSRSETKGKIKQSSWSRLTFNFDDVTVGPVQIEKCSVSYSVNTNSGKGSASADCKGDDIFALLSADQLASLQTAFQGDKNVKVKVNTNANKASIKIRCKGDVLQ